MNAETPSSIKFQIIQQTLEQPDNVLSIANLCRIAHVSRSGYYRWLSAAPLRIARELKDQEDFNLILEAYNHRGYDKGARGIYMRLLHLNEPVCMNIKKIRRLMKKYGLKCPIRKANPYRRMLQSINTDHIAANLLQREFRSAGPRKHLLTDITYLIYANSQRAYMVSILDAYTKQLLAYAVSRSLKVDFVLNAVQTLVRYHGYSLSEDTLLHSDQGMHFTSLKYIQMLEDSKLRRSISRRANCWDNAPQESFFGHMKDEVDISTCQTHREVVGKIRDWVDYYNNDRYQWNLAMLSPNEYYKYLETGIYPLNRNPPNDPFVKSIAITE